MNVEGSSNGGELGRFAARIVGDAERIARAVEHGPLDVAIAACPGWDLRQLVVHTGMVHRWATDAVVNARRPDVEVDPVPDTELAAWMRDGAARLAGALAAADPDAETWHPFPVERTVRVWGRRQALETAMHRWDAEHAVLGTSTLDPDVAVEGIGEYVELVLPRILGREQHPAPASSLHVHCTDVDGEWLLWGEDDELHVVAEHRKGDAAIRGTAATLWLALMGRAGAEELDVVGDPAVADEWLSLPGL